MVWKKDDPCGGESFKVMWELPQYTSGRGLDLGCGPSKAFPHFIGVDNYTEKAMFGIDMKPDVVCDCTKLDLFGSASMDFVFSSHLLEHLQDTQAVLREWWRVIKPGGYLILYLPHKDLYPNVGTEGANPDHKHDFTPDDIADAMRDVGAWDLIRNETRDKEREYSFFQVYKKRTDGKRLFSHKAPKPAKTAAVVRYGAFGDSIQAASILPGLKEQGFHVTFYGTPRSAEVLKHDPHIDAFYLQGIDQVPNVLLGDFWKNEAAKFDRWINLSESVEGNFLAMPGRPNHSWPIQVRRKYLDANYFEFAHDLAEVPFVPGPKFYATDEEKDWARKERKRIGGNMLLMYSLAGSSVHKVWPWQDQFFMRILTTNPQARIVTVGDEMSQMLEQGWENEARVVRMAGKYTIRQSMSLLAECDMVVGSETGMLNAAAHMAMPKIVFLSHSSAHNLTKHWVNTTSLEPKGVACFPCHRMHYSFEHCHKDEETGVALCQASISLDQTWAAYEAHLRKAA